MAESHDARLVELVEELGGLAALAVVLVAVSTTLLVSRQSPTHTEAMLQEYVSDWESGSFADLPGYFTLGRTLVNASTGSSIAPEDIGAEMADLVDVAAVDVQDLVVGSSDRIADRDVRHRLAQRRLAQRGLGLGGRWSRNPAADPHLRDHIRIAPPGLRASLDRPTVIWYFTDRPRWI